MIKFITVWFLVVHIEGNQFTSEAYTIPYATQNICLKQAKKINDSRERDQAKCKFGQMPVYVGVK